MTEPWELLLASGIFAVSALVQGSIGFGSALLAAPLLALLNPALLPAPVTLASLVLTVLLAVRDREGIHLAGVVWPLVARLPGSALGALLLTLVAASDLKLLYGMLIVTGVMIMAFGPPVRPTRRALLVAGFVSGVMGTSSSIGGPPMALVYQHESGSRLRGTLSGYFTAGAVISLVMLACVGRLGVAELVSSAALVPGGVLGFLLSRPLARYLDQGLLRPVVLWAAGLAGALLVVLRFV